jgi:hypothetical protein
MMTMLGLAKHVIERRKDMNSSFNDMDVRI